MPSFGCGTLSEDTLSSRTFTAPHREKPKIHGEPMKTISQPTKIDAQQKVVDERPRFKVSKRGFIFSRRYSSLLQMSITRRDRLVGVPLRYGLH